MTAKGNGTKTNRRGAEKGFGDPSGTLVGYPSGWRSFSRRRKHSAVLRLSL